MSKSAKIAEKTEFSGSKLYELLKGFTKEELKRFGLFIKSPYFNKSKIMEVLYGYFKKNFSRLDSPGITKENISAVIYPGEKYDDANLRKQLSNFTKLTEEFLTHIALDKKKFTKENVLIPELLERGYNKSAEQLITELRRKYVTEKNKDSGYYYNIHETERSYFLLKSREMKNPEQHTAQTSFMLDLYYISVKLLHYNTVLNLKLHYNKQVKFDMWAFDDIVKFIENNFEEIKTHHCAVFADYLSVTMLLYPDEKEKYDNLNEYLGQVKDKFDESTLYRFYIFLYNHSIYRLNKRHVQNNSELFEIIKTMDRENVPLWNYFGFHIYYVNAVTNAVYAKDFEWASEFMKKRREKINADIRDETHNLAMANYNFSQKKHKEALKYLVNVDFPNYSFYIAAKTMLIKIYWELSEPEGVLSTIDAVRKFLQRKELIPQRLMESATNFINCVSKMVDPDTRDKSFEIRKILEKEMSTSEKQWVEEKLKLIEKSA
jgi:hypothetical protein